MLAYSEQEQIDRAHRAKVLMDDDLIREAFDALELEYTEAWKQTLQSEGDKRDRLWLMLKLAHRVKGHLYEVMEAGKIAKHRLDEREGFAKRLKRVI